MTILRLPSSYGPKKGLWPELIAHLRLFDINLGQWAKLGDMNTRRLLRNMLDFFNQGQANLDGGREWSTLEGEYLYWVVGMAGTM